MSSASALAALPGEIRGEDLVASADGKSKAVTLSLAAADTLVVVFLSSRCPCSIGHQAALSRLHKQFAEKGVRFAGVNSNADETLAEARKHFATSGLPFPVIRDTGAKLADAFGALKTPHAFVVVKGEVVFQGGVDDSKVAEEADEHFLRDALAAITEGEKPPKSVARALGCVIKRKG